MQQALPLLDEVRFDHPWHRMDEAVLDLYLTAHREGVRQGAALERLRQALIGPSKLCPTCDGVGLLEGDGRRWMRGEAHRCGECNGQGSVPA